MVIFESFLNTIIGSSRLIINDEKINEIERYYNL